jgi:hypothetical protein
MIAANGCPKVKGREVSPKVPVGAGLLDHEDTS